MTSGIGIFVCTYSIALIFRGSLILRISWIWNRSRNYFSEKQTKTIRKNLDPRNISTIQYIFTRNKNQWSGSRPAGYPSNSTVSGVAQGLQGTHPTVLSVEWLKACRVPIRRYCQWSGSRPAGYPSDGTVSGVAQGLQGTHPTVLSVEWLKACRVPIRRYCQWSGSRPAGYPSDGTVSGVAQGLQGTHPTVLSVEWLKACRVPI